MVETAKRECQPKIPHGLSIVSLNEVKGLKSFVQDDVDQGKNFRFFAPLRMTWMGKERKSKAPLSQGERGRG